MLNEEACPDGLKWLERVNYREAVSSITKTVGQVKKIQNLIFEKLFEPADNLIEEWILGAGTSVSEFNRPSYKTACDIHLKHVFLTEFGLWRNPDQKSTKFRFDSLDITNLPEPWLFSMNH